MKVKAQLTQQELMDLAPGDKTPVRQNVHRFVLAARTLVWPITFVQILSRWRTHCLSLWARRPTKRLRLIESLGLGDRRFAGILEVDGRRFLIGTTPQTVTLLGELQPLAVVGLSEPSLSALAQSDGPAQEGAA